MPWHSSTLAQSVLGFSAFGVVVVLGVALVFLAITRSPVETEHIEMKNTQQSPAGL
jgi:hypothetical protein